jgi:hypothetical protein
MRLIGSHDRLGSGNTDTRDHAAISAPDMDAHLPHAPQLRPIGHAVKRPKRAMA